MFFQEMFLFQSGTDRIPHFWGDHTASCNEIRECLLKPVASPEPQSSIMFGVRVSASFAIDRTPVYARSHRVAQSGRGLN